MQLALLKGSGEFVLEEPIAIEDEPVVPVLTDKDSASVADLPSSGRSSDFDEAEQNQWNAIPRRGPRFSFVAGPHSVATVSHVQVCWPRAERLPGEAGRPREEGLRPHTARSSAWERLPEQRPNKHAISRCGSVS